MLAPNRAGAFGPKPSVPFLFAVNMENLEMKNYIEQAVQTESDQFNGGLVGILTMLEALKTAIAALEQLDRIKKALFYGKETLVPLRGSIEHPLYATGAADQQGVRIMHGILGKATESGELLEIAVALLDPNNTIDLTNLWEEIGDGFWYDAILCDATGVTFEQIQETNIAKLRKRFPNRFTAFDAQNRDLTAERAVLESGIADEM